MPDYPPPANGRIEELFRRIEVKYLILIAEGKALLADGFSIADLWAIVPKAWKAIVGIVETLEGAKGSEKKALAMYCVDRFYNEVIAPIDIPYLPNFIERRYFDPAMGRAVHEVADRAIDSLVDLFNREESPAPLPRTLAG